MVATSVGANPAAVSGHSRRFLVVALVGVAGRQLPAAASHLWPLERVEDVQDPSKPCQEEAA